jgi:hypothetical protein
MWSQVVPIHMAPTDMDTIRTNPTPHPIGDLQLHLGSALLLALGSITIATGQDVGCAWVIGIQDGEMTGIPNGNEDLSGIAETLRSVTR